MIVDVNLGLLDEFFVIATHTCVSNSLSLSVIAYHSDVCLQTLGLHQKYSSKHVLTRMSHFVYTIKRLNALA